MNRKRTTSAFTLLELVVVMVVIAIGIGVAAVSLSNTAKGQVIKDTTKQLLSLMRYGRDQSISQGHIYRLNFDLDQRTYWLTMQDFGSEPQPLLNDFGKEFTIPDSLQFDVKIQDQLQGMYVEFHPNGRTLPGEIQIKDQFGVVIHLVCESATETFHVAD